MYIPANIPSMEKTMAINGVVEISLSIYKPAKKPITMGKSSFTAISMSMLFLLFFEV